MFSSHLNQLNFNRPVTELLRLYVQSDYSGGRGINIFVTIENMQTKLTQYDFRSISYANA